MVDRINLLIKAKNVTAKQFAEEIGIQPSGMSHILSGRNNPSLDFVMKVIKRWPEVNINWLMFGMGEMYASVPLNAPERKIRDAEVPAVNDEGEQYDLFSSQERRVAPPVVREKRTPEVPPIPQSHSWDDKESNSRAGAPNLLSKDGAPSTIPSPTPKEAVVQDVQSIDNPVETPKLEQADAQSMPKKKKVVKMIVMYDDHSFAEYYPE